MEIDISSVSTKVLFLGCTSDYKIDCHGDTSDAFICPASACSNYSKWFPCRDGKYCIWTGLVCDGHAQCEDESGKETSSTLTNHS